MLAALGRAILLSLLRPSSTTSLPADVLQGACAKDRGFALIQVGVLPLKSGNREAEITLGPAAADNNGVADSNTVRGGGLRVPMDEVLGTKGVRGQRGPNGSAQETNSTRRAESSSVPTFQESNASAVPNSLASAPAVKKLGSMLADATGMINRLSGRAGASAGARSKIVEDAYALWIFIYTFSGLWIIVAVAKWIFHTLIDVVRAPVSSLRGYDPRNHPHYWRRWIQI